MKFTEAGGVMLTAAPAEERPHPLLGGRYRPGRVAPEARARIFEAFVQTDITHATQLGGAGLGLAIVARLAAAMDGEVGVGGELGQGAEFWFEAPFRGGRAPGAREAAARARRRHRLAQRHRPRRHRAPDRGRRRRARFVAVDIASALSGAPADAVLLIDQALSGPRGALSCRPAARPAGAADPEQRDHIAP
ncbi:ATP-binding protein [Caulobacter segnis]